MSYPPPKYDGDTGLANARLRRARVSEGLTMTDDERAAFMLRHDTFWV